MDLAPISDRVCALEKNYEETVRAMGTIFKYKLHLKRTRVSVSGFLHSASAPQRMTRAFQDSVNQLVSNLERIQSEVAFALAVVRHDIHQARQLEVQRRLHQSQLEAAPSYAPPTSSADQMPLSIENRTLSGLDPQPPQIILPAFLPPPPPDEEMKSAGAASPVKQVVNQPPIISVSSQSPPSHTGASTSIHPTKAPAETAHDLPLDPTGPSEPPPQPAQTDQNKPSDTSADSTPLNSRVTIPSGDQDLPTGPTVKSISELTDGDSIGDGSLFGSSHHGSTHASPKLGMAIELKLKKETSVEPVSSPEEPLASPSSNAPVTNEDTAGVPTSTGSTLVNLALNHQFSRQPAGAATSVVLSEFFSSLNSNHLTSPGETTTHGLMNAPQTHDHIGTSLNLGQGMSTSPLDQLISGRSSHTTVTADATANMAPSVDQNASGGGGPVGQTLPPNVSERLSELLPPER